MAPGRAANAQFVCGRLACPPRAFCASPFESRRRRTVERSQAGGVDAEDDEMHSALGVHGIDLHGSIIRHADMLAGSAFCVLATRRKNRRCPRPSNPNRGWRAFPPRLREVARALAAQSAGARIPTLRYQRGLATAVVLFTAPPCLGPCVFLPARRKRLLDRRRFCDSP